MHEKAKARQDVLQADVKTAQERLQALQAEGQQLTQFLHAANGALEVLKELLDEEGPVLEAVSIKVVQSCRF